MYIIHVIYTKWEKQEINKHCASTASRYAKNEQRKKKEWLCAKETKTEKPENHFEKLCGVKESGRRMVDFSTRNLFYVRTVSPIEKKERNTKKYKFSTCIHSTHRHTRNKRSFNVASKQQQQQQPVPNVFMSNIKRALWLNRLYLYIHMHDVCSHLLRLVLCLLCLSQCRIAS